MAKNQPHNASDTVRHVRAAAGKDNVTEQTHARRQHTSQASRARLYYQIAHEPGGAPRPDCLEIGSDPAARDRAAREAVWAQGRRGARGLLRAPPLRLPLLLREALKLPAAVGNRDLEVMVLSSGGTEAPDAEVAVPIEEQLGADVGRGL